MHENETNFMHRSLFKGIGSYMCVCVCVAHIHAHNVHVLFSALQLITMRVINVIVITLYGDLCK